MINIMRKQVITLFIKASYLFCGLKNYNIYTPLFIIYLQFSDNFYIFFSAAASNGWFNSSISRWGYRKFISLSELNEAENGYLKDDTIIIEAQILTVSIVKISF
jgi:hypothetical protein